MADTKQISEVDAILQIISENGSMDYIDVVNAVKKRFRLDVSSAQVEQVVHDLLNRKTRVRPGARVSLEMTTKLPDDVERTDADKSGSTSILSAELSRDDLANALSFAKSVGGLAKAKRVLEELEAILMGRG